MERNQTDCCDHLNALNFALCVTNALPMDFGGRIRQQFTDLLGWLRFKLDYIRQVIYWAFLLQVHMPVFFYIDPEFDEDPAMDSVDNITLSYTFFEAKPGMEIPLPGFMKQKQ